MKIFLSASVPLLGRNDTFLETSDIVLIKDAVRSLYLVSNELNITMVFGGHPAITPMLSALSRQIHGPDSTVRNIVMYQSIFFEKIFPEDNQFFGKIVYTRVGVNENDSLKIMRTKMLEDNLFKAAFFIGGMEGVIEEHRMFRQIQLGRPAFPVASTGAAALQLFRDYYQHSPELATEITYPTLFRRLLRELI